MQFCIHLKICLPVCFSKTRSVREEEAEYVGAVTLSENAFGVSYYQHVSHSIMSYAPEAQQEFGIGTD